MSVTAIQELSQLFKNYHSYARIITAMQGLSQLDREGKL